MVTETDCLRVVGEDFDPNGWILFGDFGKESLCRAVQKEGISVLLIEQHDLAIACREFARRRGVKVFSDFEEVKRFLNWDGLAHVQTSNKLNQT